MALEKAPHFLAIARAVPVGKEIEATGLVERMGSEELGQMHNTNLSDLLSDMAEEGWLELRPSTSSAPMYTLTFEGFYAVHFNRHPNDSGFERRRKKVEVVQKYEKALAAARRP